MILTPELISVLREAGIGITAIILMVVVITILLKFQLKIIKSDENQWNSLKDVLVEQLKVQMRGFQSLDGVTKTIDLMNTQLIAHDKTMKDKLEFETKAIKDELQSIEIQLITMTSDLKWLIAYVTDQKRDNNETRI